MRRSRMHTIGDAEITPHLRIHGHLEGGAGKEVENGKEEVAGQHQEDGDDDVGRG
jgi:hypothetical protein